MKEMFQVKNLQENIKKQWLLTEKQQQEKRKLNAMLEETIKNYYKEYSRIAHPFGQITSEEGLQNTYNFVKDVCFIMNKSVELGAMVILDTKLAEKENIISMFVNVIYQNISQTNEYHQPINKFMHLVIFRTIQENKENILKTILKVFLQKTQITNYFKVMVCQTVSKIMAANFNKNLSSQKNLTEYSPVRSSTISSKILPQPTNSFASENMGEIQQATQFKSILEIKNNIYNQYFTQILQQAIQAPIQLKVIIFLLYQNFKQNKFKQQQIITKIRQILQNSYLDPIKGVQINIQKKLKDCSKIVIFQQLQLKIKQKFIDEPQFFKSIIFKMMQIDKQELKKLLDSNALFNNAQINTYASCMSYLEMHQLFQCLKKQQQKIKQINPKLINRLNKIWQMSPQFQIFLKKDKPESTYVLLFQLQLSKNLQLDYQKIHMEIYKDQLTKNILRQVLYQMGQFHFNQSECLSLQLENIIYRQQKAAQNHHFTTISITLLTKIRYLHRLLGSQNETNLISQMNKETVERLNNNCKIYQNSKFVLLKTISNIKNKTQYLIARNQKQQIIDNKLKSISVINNIQINLCVTSPQSRCLLNGPQLNYRKSLPNNIILDKFQNCIHKQNIFDVKCHSSNVKKFLKIFCNLPQVKRSIQTRSDRVGIKSSIQKFIQQSIKLFKQQYQKTALAEQYQKELPNNKILYIPFQKIINFQQTFRFVVMRYLHYNLIEKVVLHQDLQLYKILQTYDFLKSKYLNIPSESNIQQIWQISSKYLINLNQKKTPQLKVQSLRQMLQILKIAVHNKLNQQFLVQGMLTYLIIRSKPKDLISNLNFTYVFLSQTSLLASDGIILDQITLVVNKIKSNKIEEYFNISEENIQVEKKQAQYRKQLRDSKLLNDQY